MLKCSSEKSVKYYDWKKVISCNEDVTIIIGKHGAGKEYGTKQILKKNGVETANVELQ